jgi:Txe/YoeB family toxin of Txe-Axe toxin-antitoxin module
MTTKKASLPPYLQNLPDGIKVQKLRGGSLRFTIETDLALITCQYNVKHIEKRLKERVDDLFERARTGKAADRGEARPDIAVSSGPNVMALIEVKESNVRSFDGAKYSTLKLNKEAERYIEHALELFLSSFQSELRELPSIFLIKMMAITLGNLDHSGILLTKARVTKIVDEIFKVLVRDFKARWDNPDKGRPKNWPKDKSPTAFLKVYNDALDDLKKIKALYKTSKKRIDDLIKEVIKIYPDVPIEMIEGLEFYPPKEYSRTLAALRFGVVDGSYLDQVLETARGEAKQRA